MNPASDRGFLGLRWERSSRRLHEKTSLRGGDLQGDIPERDWKYLRSIQKALLDRLCQQILNEIQTEIARGGTGRTAHETYLDVYQLVERSDQVIGDCLDDWRRSTILVRLLALLQHELLREEDLERLSEATRERIRQWQAAIERHTSHG